MGCARLSRAAFGGLALSLMMLLGSSVTVGATFSLVHSFDETENFSPNNDGMFINGLVQAKDGNLYGTTDYGGAHNLGTVFNMTPDGVLTTVVSFSDTNAYGPYSIMQASDGCFYGTMVSGGR